uniref:Uncharacterized protein n=1 Tax=Oryza barthii TaxID=65489 RepID=A0A0D3HDN7_9ORYZ
MVVLATGLSLTPRFYSRSSIVVAASLLLSAAPSSSSPRARAAAPASGYSPWRGSNFRKDTEELSCVDQQ